MAQVVSVVRAAREEPRDPQEPLEREAHRVPAGPLLSSQAMPEDSLRATRERCDFHTQQVQSRVLRVRVVPVVSVLLLRRVSRVSPAARAALRVSSILEDLRATAPFLLRRVTTQPEQSPVQQVQEVRLVLEVPVVLGPVVHRERPVRQLLAESSMRVAW